MSDQVIEDEINSSQSKLKANPFPGLRPFKIEESHLFFGREGQSDEVLLKLSKSRFVGVIGPSGSGKSSFIYCGVLPILYGGFLTNTSPDWEVIVTRPGASPIDNLASALLDRDPNYVVSGREEKQIKDTIVTTLLRSSSLGLVEAILQSKRKTDKNYLILVDQFEELFRFKDSQDPNSINETLAFVNLLMEAVNYADVPIYVGITMRSDFIGECAQFPELTKKINDSHYLIPQLTREQKRKAITGPTAVGGADITPRLIQQLLNDLGDSHDQLPILQHALMRTWSYWSNFGDIGEAVDLKHYEAIGTMSEALSMHANEAYDELDESQKIICETLFKAITEKRGENFGIRRPTKLSEIGAILDASEEEVIEVIDKFRAPGRSLLTPASGIPLSSNSIIDISHESLMRIWVRLKNWVDEEAEAVQMYLRLAEAASMYQVGKAGLWRPPDLQLALNWQVKHKPTLIWGQRYHPAFERTMVFLEYSKKEYDTEQQIKELQRKRQLQRARITALFMGGATVISLLFLLYAFQQKSEADDAREKAVGLADIATEARNAAIISADEAKKAEEDAKKAAEEAKRQEKLAKDNEQKAVIAQQDALHQQEIAEQQKNRALIQENLAKKSANEANIQRDSAQIAQERAVLAKAEADKLRYQAIASAMAVKSSQMREEQIELKGILAQQAFNFNTAHDGKVYDNDIYTGLYSALLVNDDPMVRDLGGHKKSVRAVESTQEGNYIYTGGSEGKILRWSVAGDERVADTLVNNRSGFVIRSMAISTKNNFLLAGGDYPTTDNIKSQMDIVDLSTKESTPRKLKGFERGIWKIILTPDQSGAYVLDNLGMSIKYTDFNTVKEVVKNNVRIQDMAMTADGNALIAGTNKGKILRFDLKNNMAVEEVYDNGSRLRSLAVSQDNYIAVGQEDGTLKVINLANTSEVENLVGHRSWITNIRFSNDNKFIATSSNDKSVKIWNRMNLTDQPITLDDQDDWAQAVSFSPDSKKVLVGTKFQAVKVYPISRNNMADILCEKYLTRNLTQKEWNTFVGEDLKYEATCK